MSQDPLGTILAGTPDDILRAHERWSKQSVDWNLLNGTAPVQPRRQKTIAKPVSVAGPGTFFGKAMRTLNFEPTGMQGWWFLRQDIPDALPVHVSVRNVWTTGKTVSNIVLRSGSPHNYIRMAEHIIALRMGMEIDNLLIRLGSGDPPLFKRGSLDLVEALESAGTKDAEGTVQYVTVAEKVTVGSAGSFLTIEPCDAANPQLTIDCAVDFKTAIGKQRIRFPLSYEHFRYGAEARTNTSFVKMVFCRTIGKLFADIRNLGYTMENILVASRFGYFNEAKLVHNGKSLEAVWHRAILDLLAALALVEEGRLVGHVTSYRAGHRLDCQMIGLLYKHNLLRSVKI